MNPKNTATRTAPTAGPRTITNGPKHAAPTALVQGLMLTSPEALAAAVKDALLEALAEHDAERAPAPLLVGGTEMAALIDVSRATMHRLRLEGCPCVRLGDTFKYEPSAVLAWLKARGGE